MNFKKNILAKSIFIVPVSSLFLTPWSCSSVVEPKVENFATNMTYAYVGNNIKDFVTFSIRSTAEVSKLTAGFCDENDIPYSLITLTVVEKSQNKYSLSTSVLATVGKLQLKISIFDNGQEIYKSGLVSVNCYDDPYSYSTIANNGLLFDDTDSKGILYADKTAGAITTKNYAFGSRFGDKKVKTLDGYHSTGWRDVEGRNVVEKIYINPKKSDYESETVNGVKIGYMFFYNALFTNLTYIFIGNGVINIDNEAIGDAGGANPITIEFDIENLDDLTVNPAWFKSTCGKELSFSSCIIPTNADKTAWATKLGIEENKILNKE